jgi:hypothetical protein
VKRIEKDKIWAYIEFSRHKIVNMLPLENEGLLTVGKIKDRRYIQTKQEVKVICQEFK